MTFLQYASLAVMIAGFIFYGICLWHFFRGNLQKNQEGDKTTISLGGFKLVSSQFIVVFLASALFVVCPFGYDYYLASIKPCPEAQLQEMDYEIHCSATDANSLPIPNAEITSTHMRDDSTLRESKFKTDRMGEYKLKVKKVKPDDIIDVQWADPKGGEIYHSYFSLQRGSLPITLKNTTHAKEN